ncbi:MAG TPA: hypothetical protein VK524_23610 [Polyangiaceae bacterium]|nr:hypothetical protein [Polyangiaceae bacterium]
MQRRRLRERRTRDAALPSLVFRIAYTPKPADPRENPIDFARIPVSNLLGMHILDYSLALGDLLDVAEAKIRAR